MVSGFRLTQEGWIILTEEEKLAVEEIRRVRGDEDPLLHHFSKWYD